MTNNQGPINTVAPITNVGVCMRAMKIVMERDEHLPGMAVFYGPPGYGKSMAASYAANKYRAYYIQCASLWNRSDVLEALLTEMGIQAKGKMSKLLGLVCEELTKSQRPLIIDEMDHLVNKKAVEIIRDIYEGSFAPILLIGEENLPRRLLKWERFHRRVLEWAGAEPVSRQDAEQVARLYSPTIEIADDLIKHLVTLADGSVGRVSVNVANINKVAKTEGWKTVTRELWGERPLYKGLPASRDLNSLKKRAAA